MQVVQLSMFDDPLDWIDQCLLHGSGYENGKLRIYAAATKLNKKEFQEFLKEEYGVGGQSVNNGFMDYNSKGISLRKSKNSYQEFHPWASIAKRILNLISTENYLTDKEKKRFKSVCDMHDGQIPMPRAKLNFE